MKTLYKMNHKQCRGVCTPQKTVLLPITSLSVFVFVSCIVQFLPHRWPRFSSTLEICNYKWNFLLLLHLKHCNLIENINNYHPYLILKFQIFSLKISLIISPYIYNKYLRTLMLHKNFFLIKATTIVMVAFVISALVTF